MRVGAPPWTRAQADRWRAALPSRWLPTPGVLLGMWLVVVLGGIALAGSAENATEWHIVWVVLPVVVVIVALLTRRTLTLWRRCRGRQEAIARQMAGGLVARWPGPPPDPGDARPLDSAARATRAFGKLLRDPLPITTMCVRLDGPLVLLSATDDSSPMLRLPCRLRFGNAGETEERLRGQLDQALQGVDEDGDLQDWDLEALKALQAWGEALEDLKRAALAGPLLATVYGLPVLGGYLGVAISGNGKLRESFLLPTAVARRPPRTRLGGWISSYADLLGGAPRFPG
jgi:hypothetical protein